MLCIEDNPANLRLIQHMLSSIEELDIVSAHTASLGLDLARHKPPDLILMDINLPGMDGYQALEACKSDPVLASIPVVAITAQAMQSDIERGLAAGFRAYLTKPLKIQALLQVVESELKIRKNHD